MPFTTRAFEDGKTVRMGVSESLRHELIVPYTVMTEKPDEVTAQFMFTVLLLPGGTKKVTGLPFTQQSLCKTTKCVTDTTIKALLATAPNKKKKKKSTTATKNDKADE
eukprot:GHVR01048879.1.p1 GENE.GHVR01048879.1~~GHVR01048879.1.p1  ORF type:complete len:108 (+),score=30.35 GHVR01048879.1:185-508(+)